MEHYNILPVLDEQDFKTKKLLQSPIIEKYTHFHAKRSSNMFDCGRALQFGLYEHIQDKIKEKRLENMYTCKDKFCPFCNWRRARKLAIQSYNLLDAIRQKENIRYLFLTLTVKNPKLEDTKKTITEMNKAFEKMSRSIRYKNSIVGHCKILEIHPQEDNPEYTHPHFHIILAVRSSYFKNLYIKQDDWQEMWKNALKADYAPSVDVRIIKSNDENDPIAKVVAEAFKYPMKSKSLESMTWQNFEILTEQLFRLRFISYGGILKDYREALKLDDVEDGDLIYESEKEKDIWLKIANIFYYFRDGRYGYDYYPDDIVRLMTVVEYKE
jgi:plasmid rolling circle replication initiator protein Rep